MSYTKQAWETGDLITAAKLNHIEDGVDGAYGMVVVATMTTEDDTTTLDKTYQDISDALTAGKVVYAKSATASDITLYTLGVLALDEYAVTFYAVGGSDAMEFSSETATGVLTYSSGDQS